MQSCLKVCLFLFLCVFVNTQKIVIIGGGIGGLTTAQELIEKNPKLEIHIYEKNKIFGGKARSLKVPESGSNGRLDLDGEHGFRIFPGFYHHMFDTMKRIPLKNGKTVYDNLVKTETFMCTGQDGTRPVVGVTPNNYTSWAQFLAAQYTVATNLKIPTREMNFYAQRVFVMATSCLKRYEQEYDSVSYWDFLQADKLSIQTRALIVHGITKTLLASQAEIASLRTIGKLSIRLIFNPYFTDRPFIQLFSKPTNEVFFDPWVDYLKSKGVQFHLEHEIVNFNTVGNKIMFVRVKHKGKEEVVGAHHFVSTIPGIQMQSLVTEEMKKAAPSLGRLDKLVWLGMNGIQFYLNEDVPITKGHVMTLFTNWALAVVSQKQFWNDYNWSARGNGKVKGVISICLSDWQKPGNIDGPSKGKPATQCTKKEIIDEVWFQLHKILPNLFHKDQSKQVEFSFLDPAIKFHATGNNTNDEPLFIDTVNATYIQPRADVEGLTNFFIAGDYVKTKAAFASMEASCEAGRLTAIGVLKQLGWRGKMPEIFDDLWPHIFKPAQAVDCKRFEEGKKHLGWDYKLGDAKDSHVMEMWKKLFEKK
jgi:15-cis-phytoene desaturase